MKTKSLLALIVITLLLNLFTQPVNAADATVTVNPSQKNNSIPQNFLGLSVAQNAICDMVAEYGQSPVLTQLFANLSPGVLRVGGGSVESTFWKPNASQCEKKSTGEGTAFTTSVIDGIISLAKKVNWKIIWGLPLKNAQPADIAAGGVYVSNHAGASLLALELGNEEDYVFVIPGTNPIQSDYPSFIAKWTSSANAIISQNPSIPLSGPSDVGRFFVQFLDDKHTKIMLATSHRYPAGGRDASDPDDATKKRALMLDATRMRNDANFIDAKVSKAKAYNLPMRYSEANSICSGGTPGASDTFTSALWATDYMFTLLEHGAVGLNFHSRPAANPKTTWNPVIYYSPINNASTSTTTYLPYATPIYYALLLFKYAASNGYVVPIQLTTGLNVAAHAVVNNDGKLRVIVVNKENTNVTFTINTTQSYTSANIIRLAAPSLTTTITSQTDSTVTLGRSSVAADGTWSPQTPDAVVVNGASSTVSLAPFRAAVITYLSTAPSPTPTRTPTPTGIPTPTVNPGCICSTQGSCNSSCSFNAGFSGIDYTNPMKCNLDNSLFSTTPTSQQKTVWCQRPERTRGEADGSGAINSSDYFYYVGAVNGGKIPATVNPDFNGDGEVGSSDRVIIIKSL